MRAIVAILRKDLAEFGRNRFFVFITALVIVVWVAVFWVLPSNVEETLHFGVVAGDLDTALFGGADSDGLRLETFASESDLRRAVDEGEADIVAGIAFPADFVAATTAGETATVALFVPADLGAEERLLMEGFVGEIAFGLQGTPPPVETETTVLGVDRVGDQVSLREQMRPLLLVLVLMVEIFALASLVAVEVQERTVVAVLATPARVGEFLAAKGLFGTMLAFFEAALLGLLIGSFSVGAPVIVVTLLLGAVLVTGFGMIAGAFGQDFLGTLFVAMFFMIPLAIPAFGPLFPGSTAGWIKLLPTYGLVEAVVGVSVYGESWGDVASILALLAAWGMASFAAGAAILGRRVATL